MLDELPILKLTPAEFLALPEYSASVPTGTTIGKRWRRLNGAHDMAYKRAGGKCEWMIGAYEEHPDPAQREKFCVTRWYKPVIVIPAVLGRRKPGPDIDQLTAARMAHT